MKRIICMVLAAILSISLFTACSSKEDYTQELSELRNELQEKEREIEELNSRLDYLEEEYVNAIDEIGWTLWTVEDIKSDIKDGLMTTTSFLDNYYSQTLEAYESMETAYDEYRTQYLGYTGKVDLEEYLKDVD